MKIFLHGFFIQDNMYIYSLKNKGIYIYNLLTGEKMEIIEGNEDFELKSYENQILKYDDREQKIVVE